MNGEGLIKRLASADPEDEYRKRRRSPSRRFLLFVFTCVLIGATHGISMGAAGDLDPTFGMAGRVLTDFGGGQAREVWRREPRALARGERCSPLTGRRAGLGDG